MLSPEDKLILSAVKLQPAARELEQMDDLIRQVEDWDYVAATGIDRGIAPLLYKKLPLLRNAALVPAPVQARLRQAYYLTLSRGMLMYEHFGKVARALALHGVPVVALKGIYLSEWLYGDIGLRQFSDIDVLVKPEDAPASLAILSGLGYRPQDEPESELDSKLEVVHYTPMVLNGVSIEVHVKLHQDNEKYRVGIEALWQNTQAAVINNAPVYALGLHDLLAHLCIHLDRHFYQGHVQFTCFSDITNLLDKHADTLDWEGLTGACEAYMCVSEVFRWVVLVQKYMNAPVPAEIIEKYGRLLTPADERLFVKYLHGYVGFTTGMHKHLGNFGYLDSLGERMRYAWEILFPSRSFMITKFNLTKPGVVYFYYPYRYFIGLRGLVKLIRKR